MSWSSGPVLVPRHPFDENVVNLEIVMYVSSRTSKDLILVENSCSWILYAVSTQSQAHMFRFIRKYVRHFCSWDLTSSSRNWISLKCFVVKRGTPSPMFPQSEVGSQLRRFSTIRCDESRLRDSTYISPQGWLGKCQIVLLQSTLFERERDI